MFGKFYAMWNSRRELKVVGVFSNMPDVGVHSVAREWRFNVQVFNREFMENEQGPMAQLLSMQVQGIVCGGFLWKMPNTILQAFTEAILNLHLSLLPKFGGKGCYCVGSLGFCLYLCMQPE
jgi:phosphoribosylglycinamide formyltransferase 1